jgi:hypothetical protein
LSIYNIFQVRCGGKNVLEEAGVSDGKTYVDSDNFVSVINPTYTVNNISLDIQPPHIQPDNFMPQIYRNIPMAMYIDEEVLPSGDMNKTLMIIPVNTTDIENEAWGYGIDYYTHVVHYIPLTLASQEALLFKFLDYSHHITREYPLNLPTMVLDKFAPEKSTGFQAVFDKYYVLNSDEATVSMFGYPAICYNGPASSNKACAPIQKYIPVGQHPGSIAIDDETHIVYIGYPQSGTISAINGFTDKVAVGAIFNVNPSDSGLIKCNGVIYPMNTYIYVDSGTNCTAQNDNGTGFKFNTWTESPLTNRNLTTPIEQSSDHPETIAVDRFGIFTANFELPQETQD